MQPFDGPILNVNLEAVADNYRLLQQRFAGAECAAVVKANAYGLGADEVSLTLADAGCQTFFVATLEEGIALRRTLPDYRIAVFHGVGRGEALAFVNHRLIPVINSPEQMERWLDVATAQPDAPAILHLDTGMARLGYTQTEWNALMQRPDIIERAQICLLMSHYTSAPDADDPANISQQVRFDVARRQVPQLPASLANSGGIFLGESGHYDLARPGCSLYGIAPQSQGPNPMRQVVTLSAPIIQLRTLDDTQPVGYGGTQTLPKGARLATIAIGYADGVSRALSHHLHGFVGQVRVPLVGRVTMDMLVFDVSAVPEGRLAVEGRIVLIDERQSVDDIAAMTQTIGYEVLTSIGARVRRCYEAGDNA